MRKFKIAISAISISIFAFFTLVYLFPKPAYSLLIKYNRFAASVEEKEIKAGDFTWSYLEGGEKNGDTILFIHGFGANKDKWGTMLQRLTNKYYVIAPDMPGFGDTTYIPNEKYGMDEQIKRLHDFVKKKGLKGFHIIGISMGGGIVGGYTAKYPEEIKSLTLLDAFGIETKKISDFKKNASEKDKILVYKNTKEFDRFLSYVFHNPPNLPNFFKEMAVDIQSKYYDRIGNILLDIRDSGENYLTKRLSKITVPTLILWGENDRIFDVSATKILKKNIKNSQLVVFNNCGHVPYFEKAKETNKAFSEFLDSVNKLK